MTTYQVDVWREPNGDWSAQAEGVDGAFTAGRSLTEVERNIRESIAVSLDLSRSAEAAMEIELNVSTTRPDLDELVQRARSAREEARQSTATATELTAEAATELRAKGLSVRDIAKVLDISYQRAQQLVSAA
ncbi:hypothetical protein [Tenggerimyces flavus]|uniref:HicB-like antitoxin of toxin-antitoxin system domain-containing protein n=1 Tax=Tenggerimyces flavus TaxID=1708749 RepID=A0ABV7Y8D1_9ACTN|nr:hypothetical protein [Tenggerimyces flavus]MBM7785518.1 putative RNase H-like HicB family nuclease [Tenggerimyces flavus]